MRPYILLLFTLAFTSSVLSQNHVISDVAVINVDKGVIEEHKDVFIVDGKISKIKRHKNSYLKNYSVINGEGKYLSPGFVEAHAHFAMGPVKLEIVDSKPVLVLEQDESYPKITANLLLAHGITTARDPGGLTEITVGTREAIAKNLIAGPELFVAGNIIDTINFKNLTTEVHTRQDIIEEIRKQKTAGVDFIKLYTSLPPELVKAGIEETKKLGLKSIAHLHTTTSWTTAARMGLDNIVHIIPGNANLLPADKRSEYKNYEAYGAIAFYKWFEYVDLDSPEINEMLNALVNNNVSVDPTLIPFHAAFFGNKNIYQSNENLKYMPDEIVSNWSTTFNFNIGWKDKDFDIAQKTWPKVERLVRMLHDRGIMLTVGTDANNPWVVPGDSFHTELELLVESGLSTSDVLKLATINGAKLVGAESRTGQIKKGFEADLVLLNDNPLDKISNTRKIHLVMKDGELIAQDGLLKR